MRSSDVTQSQRFSDCFLRSRLPRFALPAALLLGNLALTTAASAGHQPIVPEPRTILLTESDPAHVVIGTRRGGYFVTRDAGQSWSWMCEAGIGYDDEEVYPGVLLPSGMLVVSTGFGGVAVSPDGCAWSPWLPSELPFVADLELDPEGASVVALEARSDGAAFVNQLWVSNLEVTDWQALGAPFASDTQAVSLALSNTGEIYVAASGLSGLELLRSDDEAASWKRTSIPADAGAMPRLIGATENSDQTRLYLVVDYPQAEGLTTRGDSLLMSADRGEMFGPLLDATDDLGAAALSADGQTLVIGGHMDGIYLLADAGQTEAAAPLEQVSTMGVHALAWAADGRLYAAGHEEDDGFSIGVSDDGGRTFSPLFALCQVQGPLECPADTSVGQLCLREGETGWDVRKESYPSALCSGTAGAGTSGTAGAGTAGFGTAGGTSAGGSGASSAAAPGAPPGESAASGGDAGSSGGCSVGVRHAGTRAAALLIMALISRAWRRGRGSRRANV